MKTVLMIARFFPPEGSATSFRTLRFIRELVKRGWTATVLTAVPSQFERYDANLLRMVPSQSEIIRVKAYDWWQQFNSWRFRRTQRRSVDRVVPVTQKKSRDQAITFRSRAREFTRRVEALWYQPDFAMPWIRPATKAALELCASRRPDMLWANAGGLSALYVAQQVARCTGVPYVLDFDDAWTVTSNDHDARKPLWATRQVRRRMFHLLQGAQAVVFRYEREAECFWRAYPGAMVASKIYIIPNGFELPIEPFIAPPGDRCTILYAGTLPDYRYDTLLLALYNLKKIDPLRARRLRLLFVGEGMAPLAAEVSARGLSEMVDTSGPTSYAEIGRLQQEAHALLVLGRPATMKGYELFAGAKLFGYLKAGRPIVGVVPQDETRQVLLRVGAKTVADVDSVPEIVGVLQHLLEKWSAGDLLSLVPDRKSCEAYSSEQQTAILLRALDEVPSEKPFIPGRQSVPSSLGEIEDKDWLYGGR